MATKKPAIDRKKLTLREWWGEVGTDNVKKVIKDIDTSLAYMRMLSYRTKRPSYDTALAIIDSAKTHTPGFIPNLTVIMEPIPKREVRARWTPTIKPSAAFIKASGKAA